MQVSLDVCGVSVRRGARRLFAALSVRLGAGEALAVIGPNGVGKTSLLRAVAGFLPLDAGSIGLTADGVCVAPDAFARFIGWLGVQDGLKPQMSVMQTLSFYRDLFGGGDIQSALDRVGLWTARSLPTYQLSAGQKRRLGLARLFLSARPLWLLDEPFSQLDTQAVTMVQTAMAAHLASGGAIVAATHAPLGVPCKILDLTPR